MRPTPRPRQPAHRDLRRPRFRKPIPPSPFRIRRSSAGYCLGCHNARTKAGDLVLEGMDLAQVSEHADAWEKVVRKLRGGLMPPAGMPRPDDATYTRLRTSIERRLDRAGSVRPDPGRTEVAHRLNRLEYTNAIRDLLAVEINAPDLLPADDSSYGFDNIAGVLKMSGALIERYLSAARVISRLAVGSPPPTIDTAVYRVSAEIQQHERLEGLPFGTRGGTLIRHVFPQDAEYEMKVDISGRAANARTMPAAVTEPQLEISIDGQRVHLFPLSGRGHSKSACGSRPVRTTWGSRSFARRPTSSSRCASRF